MATTVDGAMAHYRAGRLPEAERACREILAADPGDSAALHLAGVIALQSGNAQAAVALIGKAVAVRPDFAGAHNNLGNALIRLGRPVEAIASYNRALALSPRLASAHHNLGVALVAAGRPNEAVASYRNAVAITPNYVDAHVNLAGTLCSLGRLGESEASYRAALALRADADGFNGLGTVLKRAGRLDEAIASYRTALSLAPRYAEVHGNLGNALLRRGDLEQAEASHRQAVALKPDNAEAHGNLGTALQDMGRFDEAMEAYARSLDLDPTNAAIHGNLLYCLNFQTGLAPDAVLKAHRRFDAIHARPLMPYRPVFANDRDPDRRLRVGYVSPDFRTHSVASFIEPVLVAHRRDRMEVVCYADVAAPDAMTEHFRRTADLWRPIQGLGDAEVADLVRKDRIDILVDLAGHTVGNRLLVFARRPAPVQATWIGYPNTTGLGAIDARLTDAVADPPDSSDAWHSETLVRLPDGFLCYRPPEEAPDPAARGLGAVTFGSFNNAAKINDGVIDLWAAVLRRVPSSRLMLKSSQFKDERFRTAMLTRLGTLGIAAERIDLLPHAGARAAHLGMYGLIDIGLDPFPYNGTTTTCEALWMGVPVVTMRGDRHASRVGASLLTTLGLTDLVARDGSEYVDIAARLASDHGRRAELRGALRGRMLASPLCRPGTFVVTLEAAYRRLWRQWCG